jgi:amidase
MDIKPWHYAPARDIARAIRKREISSVEITSSLLQRIEALNPFLGALVTILSGSAVRRATKADDDLARGRCWGPLHGVPCTIKDTFETAGVRTTAGCRELCDYVPRRNAAVVDGLLSAGAIILGKTNTSALGREWQTYNELFGVTKNPWDLTRTPGGSSGGCAAAVSAGLSYVSIGSDLAGSIRIPAAFCGVYGHKTSRGLVSSAGQIPPFPGQCQSRDIPSVRGLFTRDPRDLRLVLRALNRPERNLNMLPGARRAHISDYRVGYIIDDSLCPVSGRSRSVLDDVIRALRSSGARLRYGWPSPKIVEQQRAVYQKLFSDGSMADNWRRLKNLLSGSRERRARARDIWQAYFETVDVFLMPASSVSAFPHDFSEPWYRRTIQTPEGPQMYLSLSFWTSFATLAGLPVTVAPVGLSNEGLPVGIQIMGSHFDDLTPIYFSERLAELIGGFQRPGITETNPF